MFYSERKLDSTPFFIQKRRLERDNTQYANLPAPLRSGPHPSTLPVQVLLYSPPAKCLIVNVAYIRKTALLAAWLLSPPPSAQRQMCYPRKAKQEFLFVRPVCGRDVSVHCLMCLYQQLSTVDMSDESVSTGFSFSYFCWLLLPYLYAIALCKMVEDFLFRVLFCGPLAYAEGANNLSKTKTDACKLFLACKTWVLLVTTMIS